MEPMTTFFFFQMQEEQDRRPIRIQNKGKFISKRREDSLLFPTSACSPSKTRQKFRHQLPFLFEFSTDVVSSTEQSERKRERERRHQYKQPQQKRRS